jgi:hypothetical protein
MLLAQNAGELAACAEEQQTDAGRGETGDLGDLTMRVAFGVGQPQELALARLHAEERGAQLSLRLSLPGG